jgi:redox-sensitive bicupin YhaK (pirin superfamily)
MGDRLLDEIIHLEKALLLQVEQEKVRVQLWIEQERSLLEPVLSEAEQERARAFAEALAEARILAGEEEAVRRQAALQYCQRLAEMPESFLREILERSIQRILPED